MTALHPLEVDFPNAILQLSESYGMPTLVIRKESLSDVMAFLYTHADLHYQFLTALCGMHYQTHNDLPSELQSLALEHPDIFPKDSAILGVVYHVHNMPKNTRLRVKVFTPIEDPTVSSLTSLFSAADWMERETYDFYGIEFRGHPNLIRILNMDEMTYFPMRREYALEDATRVDKSDEFFGRTQGNV